MVTYGGDWWMEEMADPRTHDRTPPLRRAWSELRYLWGNISGLPPLQEGPKSAPPPLRKHQPAPPRQEGSEASSATSEETSAGSTASRGPEASSATSKETPAGLHRFKRAWSELRLPLRKHQRAPPIKERPKASSATLGGNISRLHRFKRARSEFPLPRRKHQLAPPLQEGPKVSSTASEETSAGSTTSRGPEASSATSEETSAGSTASRGSEGEFRYLGGKSAGSTASRGPGSELRYLEKETLQASMLHEGMKWARTSEETSAGSTVQEGQSELRRLWGKSAGLHHFKRAWSELRYLGFETSAGSTASRNVSSTTKEETKPRHQSN